MRAFTSFTLGIAIGAGAAAFVACGTQLEIDEGPTGDGGDGSALDGERRDGSSATDGSDISDDGGAACPADGSTLTTGCAPPEVGTGTFRCNTFVAVADSGTTTLDYVTFVSSPSSFLATVDETMKSGVVTELFPTGTFHDATTEADIQLVSAREEVELARILMTESGGGTTQALVLTADPGGVLSVRSEAFGGTQTVTTFHRLCPGAFTHVRMHVRFPVIDTDKLSVLLTLPSLPTTTLTFTKGLAVNAARSAVFTLGATVAGGVVGTTTARFDNWSTHIH